MDKSLMPKTLENSWSAARLHLQGVIAGHDSHKLPVRKRFRQSEGPRGSVRATRKISALCIRSWSKYRSPRGARLQSCLVVQAFSSTPHLVSRFSSRVRCGEDGFCKGLRIGTTRECARQSLECSAFPGGAWERENMTRGLKPTLRCLRH